jgi:arylsulfatase A-like enzyme
MLTGLHPYTYGMHSRNSVIPPDVTIVSELLKTRGYRTAGFVDSWPKGFVGGERGFSRGFDTYSYVPLIKNIKLMSKRLYHDMAATVEVAEKWITKRNPDRPFFLFMHTKSVHSASTKNTDKRDAFRFPYDKPEPYRSLFLTPQQLTMRWDPPYTEYLEHYCKELSTGRSDYKKFPRDRIDALIGQYDSGIVYTDEYIGNLLKFIEDIGLLDNSVIIITSDHGEAFLEHRLFAHKELYSQLLHVPVIMKLPWMKKGEIIDTPVSLVDIVPTLLNYIGLSSPEKLDGSPFPDSRSDKQPGRPFYGDYLYNKDAPYQGFSLQKDDKKIIYHKYDNTDWHLESYNMSTDPKEQEPLSSEHIQLKKELFRWINKKPRTKSKEIELDKETIEHLKSLGYV